MCPLESTNAEIRRRLGAERRRREQRRRAEVPIRAIDALLAELEELHLSGRKRVPDSFDERLEALMAEIPRDCRVELRSRITIVHLMDRLFAMQDCLLSRRHAGRGGDPEGHRDGDFLPRAS